MNKKLAHIIWYDSFGTSSSWEDLNEREPMHIAICHTAGFIISKNKQEIEIASSIGEDNDQVCGRMVIPVKCIKKITIYEVK